jgi:hypothetical protein
MENGEWDGGWTVDGRWMVLVCMNRVAMHDIARKQPGGVSEPKHRVQRANVHRYISYMSCYQVHRTQNRLLHIGQVDELLELNHLYRQLAWNRFLHVLHGLEGSVRSCIEMML